MLLALNASKFPWVLDILSTGSHLSLSALLSFYLTRWSITSLLSCVILFFLSSFKNFFSSGSPIDVIITGCCNFPSLVLEFSFLFVLFQEWRWKNRVLSIKVSSQDDSYCIFSMYMVAMNGPTKESCSFLGPFRLLKLEVETKTWSQTWKSGFFLCFIPSGFVIHYCFLNTM